MKDWLYRLYIRLSFELWLRFRLRRWIRKVFRQETSLALTNISYYRNKLRCYPNSAIKDALLLVFDKMETEVITNPVVRKEVVDWLEKGF